MKIHTVKGAAGVNLHVREYGKSTGIPILLIHGWSQSHLCWSKQYESPLKDDARIVALDLRGHGMSDAPEEVDQYTDDDKWADDIAAVLALDRPILVGWSYGGYIISDYLRRKGPRQGCRHQFCRRRCRPWPEGFWSTCGAGLSGERTRRLSERSSDQHCGNSQIPARLHGQANLAGRFRGNLGLQYGSKTKRARRYDSTRT
jgi:Alpha/beta hydrolase family